MKAGSPVQAARRRTVTLLLTLAAGAIAAAAAAAKPDAAWRQIHVGPDSVACGYTLPPNTAHRPLPVLLWLHGGMRSGNREKGYTAHRPALELVPPDSFYFVSPSAYAGADWLSEAGVRHIDQALQWLFAHYPANSKAITAIGVSDGTLGIIRYTLAGRYPLERRVLVSTYPDLAVAAEGVAQEAKMRAGTWDIFVGGKDRLFPAGPVMASLQIWQKSLPRLRVHFEPEGEHDVGWWFEQQKTGLIAALRGK